MVGRSVRGNESSWIRLDVRLAHFVEPSGNGDPLRSVGTTGIFRSCSSLASAGLAESHDYDAGETVGVFEGMRGDAADKVDLYGSTFRPLESEAVGATRCSSRQSS